MRKLTHCIFYIILAIITFSTCTEALDSRIKLSPTPAEYIIPYSGSEKIVLPGIAELDIKTIEIAKNEIYARHGLVFQSREMNEYFKKKSWYKADRKYKKGSLNYFEAANIRLLEGILKQPELLTGSKNVMKEKTLAEPKAQLSEEKTSKDNGVLKELAVTELKETLSKDKTELTQGEMRYQIFQSVKKETDTAVVSADKTITQAAETAVKDNAPKTKNTTMDEIDLLIQAMRSSLKSADTAPQEKIKEQVLSSVKNKPTRSSAKGDSIVAAARSMIGKPYRMGGKDPKTGFDCSGLIWWVYRQNGLETSRSTLGLRKNGIKVSPKDMKPGDIVITKNRRGRDSPNGLHAGIYIGGGAMIHAPGRGRKVVQVKLTYHNVLEGRRLTR